MQSVVDPEEGSERTGSPPFWPKWPVKASQKRKSWVIFQFGPQVFYFRSPPCMLALLLKNYFKKSKHLSPDISNNNINLSLKVKVKIESTINYSIDKIKIIHIFPDFYGAVSWGEVLNQGGRHFIKETQYLLTSCPCWMCKHKNIILLSLITC